MHLTVKIAEKRQLPCFHLYVRERMTGVCMMGVSMMCVCKSTPGLPDHQALQQPPASGHHSDVSASSATPAVHHSKPQLTCFAASGPDQMKRREAKWGMECVR